VVTTTLPLPFATAVKIKKSSQRDANTARTLAVVRFGHRPPARHKQTHRQDRLQYTAPLASAQSNEKGARRRRKHCALAVVRRSQNFRPAADPLPGDAGRPKFNHLEMVTTFTYKPSSVRIDARNFELSWYNRPTNKHTPHTQIDRTDYNTLHRS